MRKFISIIILAVLFSEKLQAQVSYNALYNLDFDAYVNKPVDSFLVAIPQNYSTMAFAGNLNNDKVSYLFILYPDKSEVMIRVRQYQFMNPVDPNRIWDLTLFKKETVHNILLFHPTLDNRQATGNQ